MRCWLIVLLLFNANRLFAQQDKLSVLKDSVLPELKVLWQKKGLDWGDSLYIRIFKEEKELEIWAWKDSSYTLFETVRVCKMSGKPGPKRRQGDVQVPEGCYWINRFYPESNYHLALRINYPNESDRKLSDPIKPGGEIYLHGHCASIGCVAIKDKPIEKLYVLAKTAADSGQTQIPVHIFPCRMEGESLRLLTFLYPQHREFWLDLKVIYDIFEVKKRLPAITVNEKGRYRTR